MREFKGDVVRIRDSYMLSSLSDIDVTQLVQEILDAAQRHRIQLNPSYAVLIKAASTIEGIMRELEPDLDIMARALPYVKQLAAKRFSAKKIATSALRTSMAFSNFLTQFPEQMDQVMMDLEGGNLTITVRNEALDRFGHQLNTLGTRLFLGISSAGLAISAALLLQGQTISVYEISLVMVGGVLCGLVAMLLFWWALGWHVVGGKGVRKLKIGPIVKFLRRG